MLLPGAEEEEHTMAGQRSGAIEKVVDCINDIGRDGVVMKWPLTFARVNTLADSSGRAFLA